MERIRQGRPHHERLILTKCLRLMREIAERPRPRRFSLAEAAWEDDREYGPTYSPGEWFPAPRDGLALTEAGRVRFLRAVWRLADEGLLVPVLPFRGKRLERIRLTQAGEKVAAELLAAEDAALEVEIASLEAKIQAAKKAEGDPSPRRCGDTSSVGGAAPTGRMAAPWPSSSMSSAKLAEQETTIPEK